jgi:hypothetical protein
MTPGEKEMKLSEKGLSEKQRNSAKGVSPASSRALEKCPKAEKDCSVCKITDCPEEET